MAQAFDNNAGTKVGMEIWRIEKMEAVRQDPASYGKFYSGDAYILLQTIQKPGSSSFEWNLHFWLGKDCSQDEQGAAAYRTVELDDQLGGGPVQFREVQGHESALFSSYFKGSGGIQYLEGGVDSAFNHVDPDAYEPRLLQCKGKRDVRVMQIERKSSAMNEGDVFILDAGKKIFQWNGANANKYEKFKGLEMVNKINADERGGKAELVFLDSGVNDADSPFWTDEKFGVGPKSAVVPDDGKSDVVKTCPPKLYRISDSTGSLQFTQEQEGTLNYAKLDTNDVFLVDSGTSCFIWVGKGASKEERKNGMKYGTDYLAQNNRPPSTSLVRIAQTGEPPAFKGLFSDWPQPKANAPEQKTEAKQADTSALYARRAAVEEKMADLNGTVEIWRINDFKKEPLDKALYGQFWAGDSFIVLYTYMQNSKKAWIIYFWQGRDSSNDEKGASALFAKEMDDELGGDPVQVRVVQNKEPQHFLALFKGKMVVHEGGVASGFNNSKDNKDTFDTDGISLFHVKGRTPIDTRAVQVAEKAASLNSGDCFVLLTPGTVFMWAGNGANDVEKTTATGIAEMMKSGRCLKSISEGDEPDAFWEALGGKGEYAQAKEYDDEEHEPRLFRLTCNVGAFYVEEVPNFVQDDLINDDVMMLDVHTEIFLWVGGEASQKEKDESMKLAMDYVKKSTTHDDETPVFRISAGFEPINFTSHFLGWDASKAGAIGDDPYLKQLAAMGIDVSAGPVKVSANLVGFQQPGFKDFTVDELKGPAPPGVDPKNKELYLSDSDFQSLFGCDKAAFEKQAAWKKTAAKKKVGLF
jgi:villin 1/advillin